jgi:hypothetical protein
MDWVEIDGMDKEWERAEVNAEYKGPGLYDVTTENVSVLRLTVPANEKNLPIKEVLLDHQIQATGSHTTPPASPVLTFVKTDGLWHYVSDSKQLQQMRPGINKHVGLCGPIDDAFMSSFVFVHPTGKAMNEKVGDWAKEEFDHATVFWRKVFRGEAPVKDDSAITPQDIANSNLVLWGDPSSNAVLAKILPKLPIQWTRDKVVFAGHTYDAAHVAPVMIFPNPLNPARYVVINSGPTFREQALLNNADQTPKLPDWAMVDLNTAPDGKWPGQILNAGFFDERWAPGK